MGRIILAVSAVAIIAMSVAVARGAKAYGIPSLLLNIVVGIGLMKTERGSYQKAILNGATPARWWPPFLFVTAISLAILIVSWFTSPDE